MGVGAVGKVEASLSGPLEPAPTTGSWAKLEGMHDVSVNRIAATARSRFPAFSLSFVRTSPFALFRTRSRCKRIIFFLHNRLQLWGFFHQKA
jgi:hypothetical protein